MSSSDKPATAGRCFAVAKKQLKQPLTQNLPCAARRKGRGGERREEKPRRPYTGPPSPGINFNLCLVTVSISDGELKHKNRERNREQKRSSSHFGPSFFRFHSSD